MGLGARLAVLFAAVAAITAVVVGGASYVTTDRQVTEEIDDFLRQRASEITGGQRDRPQDRRDRGTDQSIVVAVSPDAEVQILNSDGEIVSNTGLVLPVDTSEIAPAKKDRGARLRTVSIGGVDYRMIVDDLDGGGTVQVARSLDESARLLGLVRSRLLVLTCIAALLAALAGWIVAQRTTGPLRSLTHAVDDVAETGSFSEPVPNTGTGEVGRLALGFNRMLSALQRSEDQQRQLVQDAAHELRTPLTSASANIDWLMRATDLEPEVRSETLASVRRELTELNDVIAEIIELATDQREERTLVATDLSLAMHDVVDKFRSRSGRDVELRAEDAVVMADVESLDRAVTNLLSNADKYSPPGSPIAVAASATGIFVDDAGPGIPADERDMVFERFYRRVEDRSRPGSGLGLSIVAGIVEGHGGTMFVGDSPLGGARVGFSLPPTTSR